MQPDAGGGPVAVNGGAGDSQQRRDFRRRQAAEELHFHDLSLALVNASQFVESIVQSQKFGISVDGQGFQILEGDPASSFTLERPPFTRIVHKDLSHEPRSHGYEMGAV